MRSIMRPLVVACLTMATTLPFLATQAQSVQMRAPKDDTQLRFWLENMVWHHGFSDEEISAVTGFDQPSLQAALARLEIRRNNQPLPPVDPPLLVLPYPGGRHPRIGFLDGAIEPQRETKLSVFAPWDRTSYVVVDVPEAIWSNLGLTYLAHTHIDTLWTKLKIELEKLEWLSIADGGWEITRSLPNKISFRVVARPHRDHVELIMQLTNGTAEKLTDLRVQMCAMLKGLKGFDQQTNDNKIFQPPLAACKDESGKRWVIFGWEPLHRVWGNPPCPCLHSDPKFPDCEPGQTQTVRGWLSFYQGEAIDDELNRIRSIWRPMELVPVRGRAVDKASGQAIPIRLYVRGEDNRWHFAQTDSREGRANVYEKQNWNNSNAQEFHTSLSAHPFLLHLPPGKYQLIAERGKEYKPWKGSIEVGRTPLELETIQLERWISMADRGWYSGDVHVHRPIRDIVLPMIVEDVNVAMPMVYWTTRNDQTARQGNRTDTTDAALPAHWIQADSTHAIWPKNTEWEIFSVDGKSHTLGAVFALKHRTPFDLGIPPVEPILDQVRREGALTDMDKHDWPFAITLPPLLQESMLFELANNHMWRTEFGFSNWNTPAPAYMGLGKHGTERDWIEYTHRTYWALLNCALKIAPTAGTATGVHPVPIGFGRVYVKLDNGFDAEAWIEGLRRGKSFVTTGPMLFAEVDQNMVRAKVVSDQPIDKIEVIMNGKIVHTVHGQNRAADHALESDIELPISGQGTRWVAVRAWQKLEADRWRFAHSAPVWFDDPKKPIRPAQEEIEYLIDRVRSEIQRSRPVLSPEVIKEFEKSLAFYEELLK